VTDTEPFPQFVSAIVTNPVAVICGTEQSTIEMSSTMLLPMLHPSVAVQNPSASQDKVT
jgi:hypothetical protein